MIPFALAAVLLLVLIVSVAVALDLVPGLRGGVAKAISVVVAVVAGIAVVIVAVLASIVTAGTAPETEGHGGGHGSVQQTPDAEGGNEAEEGGDGSEAGSATPASGERGALPEGFSYVRDLAPGIEVELRYATADNFTGSAVDGYESEDAAILRTEAAEALARVQSGLEADGLGLRVYDAFRPTRAVQFFMDWARSDDDATKAEYYPDFEKPQLFELGYIAEQSGHSLGGTVDLTLVELGSAEPLDMGGPFDFFGERSHYETPGLTAVQSGNRAALHEAMTDGGFEQYPLEWWHYSYPLPADAERLDFVVR